jgi:hypothetical protein
MDLAPTRGPCRWVNSAVREAKNRAFLMANLVNRRFILRT